jgi:predicted nucleic-acid-binding protein
MRVAPDTNVLVRAVVQDDPVQAAAAQRLLAEASLIALALSSLCELVWVLRSVYRRSTRDISLAMRVLVDAGKVRVNRPAVEAGLALLDAGGDFADGVIAHEGLGLGAEKFVSFDGVAVRLLSRQGLHVEQI